MNFVQPGMKVHWLSIGSFVNGSQAIPPHNGESFPRLKMRTEGNYRIILWIMEMEIVREMEIAK